MTIYLAKIAPTDFEAFQQLLKDQIAATLEEWSETYRQQIDLYSKTDTIVHADVNPDQFARFCHATGRAYNMRSLLDFAESIAKDNQ
jgi:glyoxylate carboligase